MRWALLALTLTPTLAVAQATDPRWPYSMDFGPYLMTTFDGGGLSDFTLKGVVVPLGEEGAVAFDTELLRLSAGWTGGFLNLRGTAYDGAHGPMPALRGDKVLETSPRPGWARDGSIDDPRPIPHGPLPDEWGAYRGLYLHGDKVVLSYEVGGMGVLEAYAAETVDDRVLITRTLELGPCGEERVMVVAEAPVETAEYSARGTAAAVVRYPAPDRGRVQIDGSTDSWHALDMGGPSADDFADRAAGNGVTAVSVPGFAAPHGLEEGQTSRPLPELFDGVAASTDDDWERNIWFDEDGGRVLVDLTRRVPVHRVSVYSWHFGRRAGQRWRLYGSAAAEAPVADTKAPAEAGWVSVARASSGSLGTAIKHGVSVADPSGLGEFRWLLLVLDKGTTFISEIDVFAADQMAPVDLERPPSHEHLGIALAGDEAGTLEWRGGCVLLRVPAHDRKLRFKILHGRGASPEAWTAEPPEDLTRYTAGGPARWGEPIVTRGRLGSDEDPYAVDTIAIPFVNPYGSRMRVCAFDFFADGRAAITTWNGDVWIVSGLDDDLDELHWKRFATGLFDPLGLKIVDDVVYTHGRDGITRLHDLNDDGEADFYECFNNDVYITKGFHEFAFDLQTDAEGNFYFSKGGPVNPGGRGFQKIVPHHGTILKLSKDGSKLEVVASGLRAPNGIGVGPDGTITSGDNEGTWMPKCRLNYFQEAGFYAGVRDTSQMEDPPERPDLPLCWFPMDVDNSSGGQVWVTSDRWGPFEGELLHLSYGTCSLYKVLKETVAGQVQGGVARFPCSFASSCMRGRFHPLDGQLYIAGFQGWQTSAARLGAFHRVRYTGKKVYMPTDLRVTETGVYITFSEPLDAEFAEDPESYGIRVANYDYSQNYGSPEVSIADPERRGEYGKPNRDPLAIRAAKLSPDGRTVLLEVPDIQPVMQMWIDYNVDAADGEPVRGRITNSVHALGEDTGFPGVGR